MKRQISQGIKRQRKSVLSIFSDNSYINRSTKRILILIPLLFAIKGYAQVPSISYSGYTGPKLYTLGSSIPTLIPTNSGGAINSTGLTSTFAGVQSGSIFSQPIGVAVDASGNVYVADAGNNLIRKISESGIVTVFAGSGSVGSANGTGTAASFDYPAGLCIDASGNLYVADEYNNKIRKITSAGVVTTLAGSGTAGNTNGTGAGASFHYPCGVAVDGSGNLYVADQYNNLIRKIVISTGAVTTFAGSGTAGSANGTGTAASFNQPFGLGIDGSSNIYVADYGNNMVRKITSGAVVTTFAGSTAAGSADGTGTAAGFSAPTGAVVDGSGNIYVTDKGNSKIRKMTSAGVVTTFAGNGTQGYADGVLNITKFYSPYGIAVNSTGITYVCDFGNNVIRKIVPINYAISPALPAGLSFNNVTGAISGTPTLGTAPTDYTVIAFNSSGSGTTILNLGISLLNANDSGNLGFGQQETIKVSGITKDSLIYALSDIQKQTTRSYYDGLGRTVQAVGLQASPLQRDLIQPVAYDNLGRQTTSYLPYAGQSSDILGSYRPSALTTDQPNFYNQTSQYVIPTDSAAYSQSVFENSPLQRALQSGMVGKGFQPVSGQHYKAVSYRYNSGTTDGNILIWNPDGSFTTGNYYANSTLSVTDGKDEDNTETLIFTDLLGHTVLKRQKLGSTNIDTYYIYNMAGMLNYTIPPKALAVMIANGNYSLSQIGVSKLIFKFVYDTMGRPVQKTVPVQGVMYMVYDPLNRPVLTQDSNMRVSNKWAYIKYDAKGRAISQGTYTDATHTSLSAMQSFVNGLNYSTWYESRTLSGSTTGYYTNNVFPTSGTTPLAYSYYDDYDLQQTGSDNYSYVSQGLTGEPSATTAKLKGVPTMIWQTTIGSGLSNTWLLKVTFYDKRGNAIQTRSNNHVYYVNSTTLTDTATTVPDFSGVPQISLVKKKSASSTVIKVQTNITYDHMYRVTAVDQYYNGSSTVTHIASYSYNGMGQVIKKSLGYLNSTTWLQNVDLRFNIRGQLLSINNSKLSNDAGQTNGDTNDLFGIQMLYDKTDATLGNTAYYSGKLSAVKWMSKDGSSNSSYERAFKYYYDGLNRDTAAIYAERTTAGSGSFTTTHGWDEDRITYDEGGNIKTLYRSSATQGAGNHTTIDNLTYTYDTNNPYQLKSVADASGSNQGFVGGTGNYTYDGNGNLTNEPYKGFSSIGYNVLSKTDKIQFSSSANRYIDYTYDAGGSVIRKRQYDNVGGVLTLQNTTDYVDGFVYTTVTGTQTLAYFPMPEGRVLNSGGTLSQEYTISDQQGNIRIAFDNTGTGGTAKVRQENSYYAFGMIMPGTAVSTPNNPNLHLYNGGSEWQNDYGNMPDYYQTYYRNYDAALGRWIGVDPKAISAESMTSYQYAGNNPIMYNDPLGDLLDPDKRLTPNNAQANSGSNMTFGGGDRGPAPGGAFAYAWGEDFGGSGILGDSQSDGGGIGGNLNAGYDDPGKANNIATAMTYFTTIFHFSDGTILNVLDHSNATYFVDRNGIPHFTGWSDQGGTDLDNLETLFDFYTGKYDGIRGYVGGTVIIAENAKHRGEAKSSSTITTLDPFAINIDFNNAFAHSVTKVYNGTVAGKEGILTTTNVTIAPDRTSGTDVKYQISPGFFLGSGADGIGDGVAISVGLGSSSYSLGVSWDGITFGSTLTSGDRISGQITTFTPTPLTGALVFLGAVANQIISHPIETVEGVTKVY